MNKELSPYYEEVYNGYLQLSYEEVIEDLQKEIERLKENNENMQIEMASCWEKIDKAIEYLTDEGVCILNKGMKENEQLVWTWENYYDLLDILKGVDKE